MALILDGANGLSDVDGSASTPAIRGTDTNTGIFFPAADTIGFAEGGAEAMRIDTSGNLLVGTTDPAPRNLTTTTGIALRSNGVLEVAATGSNFINLTSASGTLLTFRRQANDVSSITTDGTNISYNAQSAFIFGTGGTTERMRIDSSGNVGIGTSSPTEKLTVNGGASVRGSYNGSSNGGAINITYSTGTNTGGIYALDPTVAWKTLDIGGSLLTFGTNGSERMRIDSAGNLLVGTTSRVGFGKVCIAADANLYNILTIQNTNGSNAGNFAYFINSAGNSAGLISQTGATTVAYATSSDYRLKENVTPMTGALQTVCQLKPVTYNWKIDGSAGQGFIAHELQQVIPDCVVGEKDAVNEDGSIKAQSIDTSFLVATLTAAIQEQQAIITDLKARIETLESK